MGRCYRAVIETWSETTNSVPGDMESSDVAAIMENIADLSGTNAQQVDYGDLISVWIEDGTKFLDFIATMPDEPKALIEVYGDTDSEETDALVVQVVSDLKGNASNWRSSIDTQGGGCLRFYID